MNKTVWLLPACLCLSACRILGFGESETDRWLDYAALVDGMDAAQVRDERDANARLYASQGGDEVRLRLAYTLSRPGASLQQLERGLEVLAEIPADSQWAAMRDWLHREISLALELGRAEGRILELKAHLDALKAIEAEMIESRQEMEEQER